MELSRQDSALIQKAIYFKRSGNFQEAIQIYKNILKRVPYSSDLYYNLGKVYSSSGSSDNALTEYMRSLHLDLIRAQQSSEPEHYYDLIKYYPVTIGKDKKACLFRVDFANTMANIGKMATNNYNPESYVDPPKTQIYHNYDSLQNLDDVINGQHIKYGINYSMDKINWQKVNRLNKKVSNEYALSENDGILKKIASWFN